MLDTKLRNLYMSINILVLFLTSILYYKLLHNNEQLWGGADEFSLLFLLITVILVHAIKAFRLYLILFGNAIGRTDFLKTYCKVTPVSMVLPFKIGEFFRMYCYGHTINNYLKGCVFVLLDRFMDTAALITIVILAWAVSAAPFGYIVFVFLLFLIPVLIVYRMFPDFYHFWNRYFLCSHATKGSIRMLKLLDALAKVHKEIQAAIGGKGLILYALSLLAWIVEISGMLLLAGSNQYIGTWIAKYLLSALGSGHSRELSQFTIISVILLIVLYMCIKAYEIIAKKEQA